MYFWRKSKSAESLRNVVHVDDTQAVPARQNWNVHILDIIIASLVRLLDSLLLSLPSLEGKKQKLAVWRLQNSLLHPYCFPGLSWRIGSVTVTDPAIASDSCRTIIAPSFIQPDTAGGALNCFSVQKFGQWKCQRARWTWRPARSQVSLMTLIWERKQPHRCSSHTGMFRQHNHHLKGPFVSPPKAAVLLFYWSKFMDFVYSMTLGRFLLISLALNVKTQRPHFLSIFVSSKNHLQAPVWSKLVSVVIYTPKFSLPLSSVCLGNSSLNRHEWYWDSTSSFSSSASTFWVCRSCPYFQSHLLFPVHSFWSPSNHLHRGEKMI